MSEGNGEGIGEDSGTSLEADVLQELGDDKVEEILIPVLLTVPTKRAARGTRK
ncbi:hypothetical protein [Streptomyces lutosisoli]|uniref:Uncharacterized protein n=1 Tax=Streptomyces lutosisoli TaxID=2665721 RepID=A0ABW2VMK8_9ACTN